MIGDEDRYIAAQVHLSMLRNRHNTLAEVERFCTGTVEKVERYAPLLNHLSEWKANIRGTMAEVEQFAALSESQREKP